MNGLLLKTYTPGDSTLQTLHSVGKFLEIKLFFTYFPYQRFCWYMTLENKTPAETFPKFPSDRIEIHQLQPPVCPSNLLFVLLSADCDWWILIRSAWSLSPSLALLKKTRVERGRIQNMDPVHGPPWTRSSWNRAFAVAWNFLTTSEMPVCHVDFQLLTRFDWQAPVKF